VVAILLILLAPMLLQKSSAILHKPSTALVAPISPASHPRFTMPPPSALVRSIIMRYIIIRDRLENPGDRHRNDS
jgi:hypothetical protein